MYVYKRLDIMRKLIIFFSFPGVLGFGQTIEINDIKALDLDVYSKIIEHAYGDLDGDDNLELMLIVNRLDTSEFNTPRDLLILKMSDDSWYVWKKSSTVILGTDEGGINGDPFQAAYIDDNEINISHEGGSRWRWSVNQTYCLSQDTFILTSYYSYSGALCDTKTEVDFNLSSGKVSYVIGLEECPEGFGDNTHLLDALPITEDFFYKGLRIDLFQENRPIINIVTPLNQTFSIH